MHRSALPSVMAAVALVGTIALADDSDVGVVEPVSSLEWAAALGYVPVGGHCATAEPWMLPPSLTRQSVTYCGASSTTIRPEYNPGEVYEIPVVVHIITTDDGVTGNISDAMVKSQIDILNEDYLAIPGSPGASGTYAGIRFVLADTDPDGYPTTGIERIASTTYYNANAPATAMKTALHWDTTRYLNLYTNFGDGYLGWSTLPASDAGLSDDGVVICWEAFGRDAPLFPYDQGRTATHEIGHYLGLYHPWQTVGSDACLNAAPPDCYSNGDVVCDTNPDDIPTFDCIDGAVGCHSFRIPVHNYMEYTDDYCMTNFTPEQVNRARCSVLTYRPSLYRTGYIFGDGFEYGKAPWSAVAP